MPVMRVARQDVPLRGIPVPFARRAVRVKTCRSVITVGS